MTEYLVRWEINVTADSCVEAAQRAQAMQRDPETTATFYEVSDGRDTVTVDLEGF